MEPVCTNVRRKSERILRVAVKFRKINLNLNKNSEHNADILQENTYA